MSNSFNEIPSTVLNCTNLRRTVYLTRFLLFAIIFHIVFGSVACLVSAQDSYLNAVGVPSFTTDLPVEQGQLNADKGILHIEIPLGTFPQRGGRDFKVSLMYDSSIWNSSGSWQPINVRGVINHGWDNNYQPPNAGWRLVTSATPGVVSYSDHDGTICSLDKTGEYLRRSNWDWTSADSTTHTFAISTTQGFRTKCNDGTQWNIPSGDAVATDASGYHMFVTNFTTAKVYGQDGTLLYGGYNAEDSNGNY